MADATGKPKPGCVLLNAATRPAPAGCVTVLRQKRFGCPQPTLPRQRLQQVSFRTNLSASIDTPLASFVEHTEMILQRDLAARRDPSGTSAAAITEGLRPSANQTINAASHGCLFC